MSRIPDRLLRQLPRNSRYDGELGIGGTGWVDRLILPDGTKAALKYPRQDRIISPADMVRFENEILIVVSLNHPGIVRTYHWGGVGDAIPFWIFELAEYDLARKLATGGLLSFEAAVQLVAPVGDALSYLHGKGIVHRDVKLDNLLYTNERVLLADFGTATGPAVRRVTPAGMVVGTPQYMPSRQLAGEEAGPETDWFGLACAMVELACGRLPRGWTDGWPRFARTRLDRRVDRRTLDALCAGLEEDPTQRPRDPLEWLRSLGVPLPGQRRWYADEPQGQVRAATVDRSGVWRRSDNSASKVVDLAHHHETSVERRTIRRPLTAERWAFILGVTHGWLITTPRVGSVDVVAIDDGRVTHLVVRAAEGSTGPLSNEATARRMIRDAFDKFVARLKTVLGFGGRTRRGATALASMADSLVAGIEIA